MPLTARFTTIANAATAKIKGKDDHARAQALYRHVLDHMRYSKTGKGWGRGDALYACDARTGNCTDFHAYFIALCRAVNIPARFAIGFTIPADKNAGAIGATTAGRSFMPTANGCRSTSARPTSIRSWPITISAITPPIASSSAAARHHRQTRSKAGPFNYFFGPHLEVNGKEVPERFHLRIRHLPARTNQ